MSRFLILTTLCLALPVAGCATTGDTAPGSQADAWATCRIVTDLARQIDSDNYDPKVDGRDCTRNFAAAGLPMKGFSPTDPDRRHIIRFATPQKTGVNTVTVPFSDPCPLCGHGEEADARLDNGRWTITARRHTWIS